MPIHQFKLFSRWSMLSLAACACLLGASSAIAENDFITKPEVLLTAPNLEVTTLDVMAEIQRVPAEQRKETLTKPETVGQIVQNIFLRRALTQTADQQGISQSLLLQRLTQLNRERLMTDAYLEHLDKKNELSQAQAEKLAAIEYKTNPKKFKSNEEVEVAHILIRFGDDKDAAKAKAQAILHDLKNGADFSAIAKEKSEDPGSAAKGGELGRFGRGRMVKSFEEAAFAMKTPGEISDIVESQYGYHILKMQAYHLPKTRPFDEVKAELIKEVQQKSIVEGRKHEAERLNNEAVIQSDALQRFVDAQREVHSKPNESTLTTGNEPAKK